MADLDFEIEVRSGVGREYELAVIRSPAGEARQTMVFPFDELALQVRLQALEIALLRSGGARRRLATTEERTVQQFGGDLFDALIGGEVRSRFDVSRSRAQREGKALRVKLRFDSPAMAALPWEFLYDARRGEYLVLSTNTPLVRYIELPEPTEPLTVTPPLRMLALVASPNDLPHLEGERERLRVEEATKDLQARGLLEVHWLPDATWRAIQGALRRGPWHIFHFVGHGGFDSSTDEGLIALVDEKGGTFRLAATELARLLGDHYPLRLAVLNACEGARGSSHDLFSSTAATLVRRGTPAVVAMQYEITDRAAIEFGRSFYEAIADGYAVDAALSESRKAVSVAINNTLEWGTAALFMRSPDGVLFTIPQPAEDLGSADSAGLTPVVMSSAAPATAAAAQPAASADLVPVSAAPVTPSPASRAETSSERSRVAAVGALDSASGVTRRLVERGWRTGHIQTLIGAELGVMAGMSLGLGTRFQQTPSLNVEDLAYAIWILAVAGAFLVLRVAGPRGWWKTVIWLALMAPLFKNMAVQPYYTGFGDSRFLIGVAVAAILALAASSLALLGRPRPD